MGFNYDSEMGLRVIKSYSSEWEIVLFPLPFHSLLFLVFNWFFILMTQMVSYRNFSYLWNKLLQIRFKCFKKSWATPFSHSGLSLYKPIKVWIKDLPAWINIPLWDIWVSFLSLFYHVLSVFSTGTIILVNPSHITITGHFMHLMNAIAFLMK